MENKISVISTTCKNCLFAEYDGDTQINCALGKVDKIRNHPIYQILEATDGEKNFYILNYHLCLQQRVPGWVHDKKSINEMKELVREEIKMNWGAILVLKNEPLIDMSRVEKRLEEILNQTNPPSWIGIINHDNDLDVYWIINYLSERNIKWSIESGEETTRDYIDIIMKKFQKNKFVFYGVFESDKKVDSTFYDKLYRNVIENLMQYSVIKDSDSLHGMIVNKVAHIKYNGNHNIELEKKIKRESDIALLLDYKDLL